MNTPTAKGIVGYLVRMARSFDRFAREYPHSREYWRGMSRGHLSAARHIAHETYGLDWLAARDRKKRLAS
jgi:hypothetical protein